MVLIYTNKSSPRLQYIAAFIFKELIRTPYAITGHSDSFKLFEGIRLNYTNEKIADNELYVPVHGLLNQTGISDQGPAVSEINGYKAFFTAGSKNENTFPFDIFSAAFYLLSRYEEYLPHNKDRYGRYAHTNSLAFKNNFLSIPLINIWVKYFTDWLQQKSPNPGTPLSNSVKSFEFRPTYDIDMAYSYLHKGFIRNAGGMIRSLLSFKFSSITERANVLVSGKKDPFDHYDWLDVIHKKYDLNPLYFFLVAEKKSRYDKNIDPANPVMKHLIKQHSKKYTIGLHPSWQSGDDETILEKEKNILGNITGLPVDHSRQHYIRMDMPVTYRNLVNAGIRNDYSMGFSTINGFRASVASTFSWYDLQKEEQTKLRVNPFCYMDNNAITKQKLSPDEALEEMSYYYRVCRDQNGRFIPILHNNLFEKTEWRSVYEKLLGSVIS